MTLHVKLCACKVSVDRNFNFCLNVEVHDYLKAEMLSPHFDFFKSALLKSMLPMGPRLLTIHGFITGDF